MDKKGVTLVELIIVIAILGVLAAVAFIQIRGLIETSREKTDIYNLKTLNSATSRYRLDREKSGTDEFSHESDSEYLMGLLIPEYISEKLEPKQKDYEFIWDANKEKWILHIEKSPEETALEPTVPPETLFAFTILGNDNVRIDGYADPEKLPANLVIPSEINGIPVSQIANNSFQGVELISVYIPNSITEIRNNAFSNTGLKTVTIGSDVNFFQNQGDFSDFVNFYKDSNGNNSGGGTFVYNKETGAWKKAG